MQAADGLLMRVRLPGGVIAGSQLDTVAEIAARFGNGVVEITTRANLQIRGVDAVDLDDAAHALVSAGLSDGDAGRDARRAIVAPALAGHDPETAIDVSEMVVGVQHALADADLPGELPAKFSVVIDDGTAMGVGDVAGDVVIEITGADSPDRVASDAVRRAAAIAAGIDATPRSPRPTAGPQIGVHRHRDPQRSNVIAAPGLGRLDVGQLRCLAGLAPLADVRFTHRRSVALAGVHRDRLPGVLELLTAQSLSTDATDPMHTVTACAGSPGCASSRANTSAAVAELVASRRSGGPPHTPVHFSGCEKLCGAPTHARHVIADSAGRFGAVS